MLTGCVEVAGFEEGFAEASHGLVIPTSVDHTHISEIQPEGECGEPLDGLAVIVRSSADLAKELGVLSGVLLGVRS